MMPLFATRLHLQVVSIVISLALAGPLLASEKFEVTLSGSVKSVDPLLLNTFHVGDPFEFGFLLDTANLVGYGSSGTTYNLKNVYFKVGSNYSASGPTGSGPVYGYFTSVAKEHGGTDQGFRFEQHDLVAPRVNNLPLSDTGISISFDRPLNTPVYGTDQLLGPAELLTINDRSIVDQNVELLYGSSSPVILVKFNVTSMRLVPEPAWSSIGFLSAILLGQRRRRQVSK